MNIDVLNYKTGEILKSRDFAGIDCLLNVDFDPILSQVLPQIKKANVQKCARTKQIAEISISTSKIRPQKGSGRSRQGSGAATHFRGGAKAFGPVGINKTSTVPWKMRRMALLGLISKSIQDNRLVVVDDVANDSYKTKNFVESVSKCIKYDLCSKIKKNVLVVHTDDASKNIMLGTRNLFFVENSSISKITTKKIMSSHFVMFTEASFENFIKNYLDI